ncbi:uncharacterized protein LOC126906681 [Daktulosphaira vitifoliae]|uniref:uncharacterized protein LOC126906681 n=1 Tax=Daktulosphaira vitifoliae TaxID=58002 RepID=UPI0021AA6691|nr:uncharacterized protein LOC126906681 [Daktulosphaira vitifoliae]
MTTLWTCSRALEKTWGLKPRVMYWLYTSVIKPMILYGALVKWIRTALDTDRKELSRIHDAMAITTALRTTPTVALEALIGLPLLHLEVKAHPKAEALRFHNLGMWTLESDTTEHGKILIEIDQGFLEYPLDYIKLVLKNNIPYKVEITTRREWNINHLNEKRGFVIYTDGSKKSGKVGAGIWGLKPRINVSMSLGTTPSVFQAEVMAILVGAQNLLVYKNRKITILSDSQAALKALCNDQVNSKLVLECRETLESLSRFNKVTLAWVPGHNGVTGNENADFLARKGAENTYVGPEPVVGLTEQSLKALPKNWCREQHRKIWKYLVVPRQSKMFIKTPGLLLGDPNSMTRHQMTDCTLTGLLTGHGHLLKNLNAMGVLESPLCREYG